MTSSQKAYQELHRRTDLIYRFTSHSHPYAGELLRRFVEGGVDAVLRTDTAQPPLREDIFGPHEYDPRPIVGEPYPVQELDYSGPYGLYNEELFFHLPFTLGLHASRNQHFAEARRWFSYVFDPAADGEEPLPQRYWQYERFRRTEVQSIEEILVNLASNADPTLRLETLRSINAWRNAPFQPHAVARVRPSAYMMATVFAVLDNLIEAGDQLYRQDTRETINEATQYYVLAAQLLGPRPQSVPRKQAARPQTYAQLRADLDEFGNALRAVETDIPFAAADPAAVDGTRPHRAADGQAQALAGLGTSLYFGVPRDDKLLDYWDRVEGRLFNIRNSLNIQGTFRQLPLTAPRIDPALLARAAAAGVDVGAVASGANQPLPLVRFRFLVQKATEICQEARSLGGALLSAMEKGEAETLTALRAHHETALLGLGEPLRYAQLQEAKKATEGVQKSFDLIVQRYTHYGRLLGLKPQELTVAPLDPLEPSTLDELSFQAAEPAVGPVDVEYGAVVDEGGKRALSGEEQRELAILDLAQTLQDAVGKADEMAATMQLIPTFGARFEPFGAGGTISYGGSNLSGIYSALAASGRGLAGGLTHSANRTAKLGVYDRRRQDWALQFNVAAAELTQVFKQWRAAQLREYIAAREWAHHIKQRSQAQEIQRFLAGETGAKTTTAAFWAYQRRETRGLFTRAFDLALEVAGKAERALRHELGRDDVSFLSSDYLAGPEKLLAGDRLALDIKRMEVAYHDLNEREYEMVRHVSLARTDPLALMRLRATGRCSLSLREEDFDTDAPGQFFRRIRSVAVSVPGVPPYGSGVNLKLTLVGSSIRTSTSLDGGYARRDDDARFSDHFGAAEAVIVCEGVRDTGQDARDDERLKKFERAGVISDWELELPHEIKQFDHFTLDDVHLHIGYTAREGGSELRTAAVDNLETRLTEGAGPGSVRLLSVAAAFPDRWAQFLSDTDDRPRLALPLRAEHYPYWSEGRLRKIVRVELLARADHGLRVFADRTADAEPDLISASLGTEVRTGDLHHVPRPAPISPEGQDFVLYFDSNALKDLWIALTWANEA
ncbi:hypothetical protein [Streptomyces sp. NPDC005209]|uniref:Tc toxin subunit A-related protein n=1 Tax=Streptomyces sp. NPDC005209 TaxID=3156715 RepID=UPI0033B6DF10